jgi:hypothetical protein
MTIKLTRQRLEERFKEFDEQEQDMVAQIERPLNDRTGRDLLYSETDEVAKWLTEAREGLDGLLKLLQTNNVVVVNEENLGEDNREEVVELASKIYTAAKLALHIRHDADEVLKDFNRKRKGVTSNDKYIAKVHSLTQSIKSHFILTEVYTALGVRFDLTIKNYNAVIEEGKELYRKLKNFAENNGKPATFYMMMITLAHDIGAAYKRKYDLENPNTNHYGYDQVGIKSHHEYQTDKNGNESLVEKQDPLVKVNGEYMKARKWFHTMSDLMQIHDLQDISSIFHTQYEFDRYLEDIYQLKVACIYSGVKGEALICNAPDRFAEGCDYNEEGVCDLVVGVRNRGNEVARIEHMLESRGMEQA